MSRDKYLVCVNVNSVNEWECGWLRERTAAAKAIVLLLLLLSLVPICVTRESVCLQFSEKPIMTTTNKNQIR